MPRLSNKERLELCESIAETVKDFRKGEIPTLDAAHVNRWATQFPALRRKTILVEMDHLLAETYFSKADVRQFLDSLIEHEDLLGGERPKRFWRRVNFLRLQGNGSSQNDLLNVFGGRLRKRFGFWTRDCGSKGGPYFYFDDFIFTGSTVRRDILDWLRSRTLKKPDVHLVFIAFHTYGQYYAQKSIAGPLGEAGGSASYWRNAEIEDRKTVKSGCDVLRPRKMYSDDAIAKYASSLSYEPALRHSETNSTLYKTERGRRVLEHEFLRTGLRIRGLCSDPESVMRPLGFSSLESFGTGAIVATYRNCPNTAPLAWWWGDPQATRGHPLSRWHPLLPRKYRIH